jgi:uncharacterized protein (UPF0264 family)
MEAEQNGLVLWCCTDDAPGPPEILEPHASARLTIGVRPQRADTQVVVLFRIGEERTLHRICAVPMLSRPDGRIQYFLADFPRLASGAAIEYWPCAWTGAKEPSAAELERWVGSRAAEKFWVGGGGITDCAQAGRTTTTPAAEITPEVSAMKARTAAGSSANPQLLETPARPALERANNRKLLVSVFTAQEAREAILGGGRIIDSEDPRSALGNIRPSQIMAISDAVLDFTRDLELQLSTNIGEDQLLFRRDPTGQASEKSPYEIAGKASQAAIGVACAMGTRVHPCNIIKVGLDGMEVDKLIEVLSEVVSTLRRTEQFSHAQVMSVLFAQDLALWEERQRLEAVRRVLVELREYYPAPSGGDGAFDLREYSVNTLRGSQGRTLFPAGSEPPSLGALVRQAALPEGSNNSLVRLNPLFDHRQFFPDLTTGPKTTRGVIKAMVDATADAGANAIMIDTSILSKVSNVCLVDTDHAEMVDVNPLRITNGVPQRGILSLDDIRFFVEYCHFRGLSANIAGSVESYQAQQLWVLVPNLDQISTRGAASGVESDPSDPRNSRADTRQHRVIKRNLVRGLAPPEAGGVLNLPVSWRDRDGAEAVVRHLSQRIAEGRASNGWPPLETYYVDSAGVRVSSPR